MAPLPPLEPLLDAKEVARILGLNPETVLRLARLGQLPGVTYARHWRFRPRDIQAWIENRASGALPDVPAPPPPPTSTVKPRA